MKIKENIKKTGNFWLPPFSNAVRGTLSISNEEGIVLEVDQNLSPEDIAILPSLINPNSAPLGKIFGHIQEYGFVILDGCQSKTDSLNLNYGALRSSRVILANRVFTGFPAFYNEIPPFNTLTFSIEGIDEWINISGLETDYTPGEPTATISYNLPESISFNLTDDIRLEVVFTAKRPDSLGPKEAGITEKIYFRLVSEEAQDFSKFVAVAQKITDLLCFAINEAVSLDSMSAASDALSHNIGDNITVPAEINIYDLSLSYSKDQPQIRQDGMLFKFSDIQDDAERVINKWIESSEQYEHAFNLYFLAQLRSQPSLRTKFLSLAQCLEVYHRTKSAFGDKYMEDDEFKEIVKPFIKQFPKSGRNWFAARLQYSNEFTLRDRIREIIKPFEGFIGEEQGPQLINYIVNTRNYLTHYNSQLKSEAAEDSDLYVLCQKMEMLFELRFLELIGFSQERINSIQTLQRKCSLSFSNA